MSVVFSRAPLRVSLGGGGTDLPSYYRERGGFLVGGAIDKYVYMLTHTVFQRRYRMKYSSFEEVDQPSEIEHPILRESLLRHWSGDPLEVSVVADVPAGTGLGSSGSFTVCLLKALALARRVAITPGRLAEDACEIEIDVLGEPTGKQDQYVAAHGGICAYTFNTDGSVDVEPLELSRRTLDYLRNNLLLFYTGEARSASAILADQVKRTEAGDETMRANLAQREMVVFRVCLGEQGPIAVGLPHSRQALAKTGLWIDGVLGERMQGRGGLGPVGDKAVFNCLGDVALGVPVQLLRDDPAHRGW